MNWVNLSISTLTSREFITADPECKGAWITLIGYSVIQENRGVIRGARRWAPREWSAIMQIQAEVLDRPCGLWKWKKDDLHISFYPRQQHDAVQAMRAAGKEGQRRKKQLEKERQGTLQGTLPGTLSGQDQGVLPGTLQGNIKEYKVKEGKVSAQAREDSSPPSPDPDSSAQIPSIAEVRTWAMGPAGVDPDWAQRKAEYLTNTHGWIKNGRLIKWQRMFKADFERDRAEGKWPRPCQNQNSVKSGAASGPREDWMIEKELRAYQVQLEEHPMSHAAMGQSFTEEEKATYKALIEHIKALKRERRDGMKGEQ